jgi:hypothetical protein
MSTHQDILFGVASQTLVLDCPEGRPSSVTSVQVFYNYDGDDATAVSATTGSASVETNPNTTIDAASGDGQSNPRTINLTSTTGVSVGREYLITGSSSETEWAEIVEVSSGASATSRHPLRNAYVATDTFESTRISISLDDTWAADSDNISGDIDPNALYRVRWVYVVGSSTYVRDTYFDVVRYEGQHNVTGTDIDNMSPGFLDSLPHGHIEDQGRKLIDEAYKQVSIDLHQEGKADQMARQRDIVDELVKRKTLVLASEARIYAGGGSLDAVDAARTAYHARFDQLIRAKTAIPFATDAGGGATEVTPLGITRR